MRSDGNERAPAGANGEGSNVYRWLQATGRSRKVQAQFRTVRVGARFETSSVYGRIDLSLPALRLLHAHLGEVIAAEGGGR